MSWNPALTATGCQDVSETGRAAAEAYARKMRRVEDGVRFIDVAALDELVNRSQRESVYFHRRSYIRVKSTTIGRHARVSGGSRADSVCSAAMTWRW